MRSRIVVVGAGIAGLVAASKLAASHDVVLVEADDRLGGKLQTGQFQDRPLDLGPDSFVTRSPFAKELCTELGLAGDLVAPRGAGAAIWARGALRAFPQGTALGIPTDFGPLGKSGVLSTRGLLRARLEPFLPGRRISTDPLAEARAGGSDPSVEVVVKRRFGPSVLANLVDPLLGGINASDVSLLSFAAAAPDLAKRSAGARSLSRALATTTTNLADAGGSPAFLGLKHGMAELVVALRARIEAHHAPVRKSTSVESIERTDTSWLVHTNVEVFEADGVVLATPSYETARILASAAPELAQLCRSVSYANIATISLSWKRDGLSRTSAENARRAEAIAGNGFLVARTSRELLTAVTFTSTKWPHSAREGELVLRASVGRHNDDRALVLSDDDLVERVTDELARKIGINDAPVASLVKRWPLSFPQYVTGHLARVEEIDRTTCEIDGLVLTGAYLHGIGIPACIADATRAADELVDRLSLR